MILNSETNLLAAFADSSDLQLNLQNFVVFLEFCVTENHFYVSVPQYYEAVFSFL